MKLSSGLKRELSGPFVLDEDGLLRIAGLLNEKGKALGMGYAVVLAVHREDDRFYETTAIADVLSDANEDGHRIQMLSVELRINDEAVVTQPWERKWIAQVVFKEEKNGLIQININSEDRTWALLVADELEPQVRRTRSNQKISTLVLVLFFFGAGSLVATLIKGIAPHFGLSSATVDNMVFAAWGGATLLAFFALEPRPQWLTHFTGPESAFSWGERAKSYQRNVERQKNLFWVIFVGLALSIVSSAYTSFVLP